MGTEHRPQDRPGTTVIRNGRRAHDRVECDLHTKFVVEVTGQTGTAPCVNIGLGGMRIDFPFEILAPTDIQVRLKRPEGEDLDLVARVIWTVTERVEAPFPTGLQFHGLSDADRAGLQALIEHLSG